MHFGWALLKVIQSVTATWLLIFCCNCMLCFCYLVASESGVIEFRHLRNFSVLAKEQNYQKAAKRLNLAQPSLTRSIQRLESLLGTELLNRGHQSMTLTASGELVLSHSDTILDSVDTLRKELHCLLGKSSGHLLIGASPVPANTIIGPAIGRFIEQHPDVHVELKVATWQQHIQQLLQGKLSLLVTDIKGEALGHDALLQTFNLPSYHAVFCVRKNHPLAVKPELTLADIRHYPLAIPRNLPTGVMESFADLFSPYRDDFAGLLRYDTFQPISAALQHSQMVALAPQVSVIEGQTKPSLCVLSPIDMPPLDVCFSIVMLKKQNCTVTSRFVHQLLSSVAESSIS